MSTTILMLAIPFFLVSIAVEWLWDLRKKTGFVTFNDAFGSLAVGILSRSSKVILWSAGAFFIHHYWVKVTLWQWPADAWYTWVFTFIAYDFVYYWTHRAGHSINFFWAGHVVHHQSEEFNLTTALRQTSTGLFTWIFALPLLWLGVPVEVYATCTALNLIYQFWVHTRHIGTLGWFERWFVTPSHHRVHHGQNPEYIDKNHGGVFIIWDKWFGTFQQEMKDVEPIYGVRRTLANLNPFFANVHVWWSLFKDAWYCEKLTDAFKIWWMPTGWRPEDQMINAPIKKSDLQHFRKYDPGATDAIKTYAGYLLVSSIVMLVHFLLSFENHPQITKTLLMFFLVSAPLLTGAWLLEGRSIFLELTRIAVSAVSLIFIWQDLTWGLWVWAVHLGLGCFGVFALLFIRNQRNPQPS